MVFCMLNVSICFDALKPNKICVVLLLFSCEDLILNVCDCMFYMCVCVDAHYNIRSFHHGLFFLPQLNAMMKA